MSKILITSDIQKQIYILFLLPDSDAKTQLYDSDAHILYLCFCI